MSYLVLARKYRPQTFTDMAGQGHVVRTLQNAIASGRVAHAFLFTGARGVGKTTSARLMAKALNCHQGPTIEPCGVCPACTEIAAGNSVDVLEIDGASNNGVDQVRELRDNARYLPSRDRFKIYIIDEVHMLSGAAFNALLKTLEEPPPHVKFIFATTEPHKIPVTILSRTQRYDFRRIALGVIVDRLRHILSQEGIVLSDRAIALVARQAEGSMRDALSLLDQVVSATAGGEGAVPDALVEEILGAIDRTAVARVAGALIDRDAATVLQEVAQVFDRGLDLKRLAEDLAWHLRNLMVVQVGGGALAVLDVPDHERAGLQDQAGRADPATLAFLFDAVHQAAPEVGRAIQPRLALEVALLKAIHLAPGADVQALLERVEALSGGAPPPAGPRGGGPRGGGRPAAVPARAPVSRSGGGGYGAATAQALAPEPEPEAPAAPAAPPPRPAVAPAPPPPAPAFSPGDKFGALAARLAAKAGPVPAEAADGPPEPPWPDAPPPEAPVEPPAAPARPARKPRPAPAPEPAPKAEAAPAPKPEAPPARKPEAAPPAAAPAGPEMPRLQALDAPEGDLASRFAALVRNISEHAGRPFIAAALEHARPLEIGETLLQVALPRGLYYDGLGSAANRRVIESLVADHFGRPLEVRLEFADAVKLDGAPEAIATVRERELAQELERLRAEALNNPGVRLALEVLDGEIEEIRILNENP